MEKIHSRARRKDSSSRIGGISEVVNGGALDLQNQKSPTPENSDPIIIGSNGENIFVFDLDPEKTTLIYRDAGNQILGVTIVTTDDEITVSTENCFTHPENFEIHYGYKVSAIYKDNGELDDCEISFTQSKNMDPKFEPDEINVEFAYKDENYDYYHVTFIYRENPITFLSEEEEPFIKIPNKITVESLIETLRNELEKFMGLFLPEAVEA